MVRKKKYRSKHEKPTKGVFIAVDEAGSVLPTSQGKYYVAVASITDDRYAFRDIVEDMGLDHEIGFSEDRPLAPEILRKVGDVVDDIYVAYLESNERYRKDTNEAHLVLLRKLNEVIPYDGEKGLLVMVDRKAGINPEVVESIFTEGKVEGDITSCVVVPSNYFCEMQTNDFVTGAVRRKLEKNDRSYINYMGVEPKMFRTKNRRSGRTSTRTVAQPATDGRRPLRGRLSHPMEDDVCSSSNNDRFEESSEWETKERCRLDRSSAGTVFQPTSDGERPLRGSYARPMEQRCIPGSKRYPPIKRGVSVGMLNRRRSS